MAEMLPIVGFVGFVDGATTIGGGGTTVTGVAGVPIGGLLGGVVVIVSDFLFLVFGVLTVLDIQFLVFWSVNCA